MDCKIEACERIWQKDISIVAERIQGINTGLKVQARELERRMHEANEMKSMFGDKVEKLDKRVVALETKSIMWIVGISGFFTLLQIVMKYWKG